MATPKPRVQHVKDLRPDPRNRRAHNPRNLGMLVDALHQVGAARSIVIDEDDVVLAGNGVTEAAAEAGITTVRVIEASGDELIAVRRRGLTDAQKRALAIYDNRTAELATWDPGQLGADAAAGLDLSPWFSADELAALLPATGIAADAEAAGVDVIAEQFHVLVQCRGESEQAALLERLTAEGLSCRALIS